ncbi:PH domain-containing protein [Adlercreutzia sp. R21]|uniref:PH domain-containing protein n=1 Tax=Adlercreutzia wanghongyangiae TaxID=3111451 RepID=UPI002DBF364F|nr:PH domain-containing protein [Adlercreutzia sp. R21]MEC4185331.1 PH domain-containing protein [Adlercreutzia sp. R21]
MEAPQHPAAAPAPQPPQSASAVQPASVAQPAPGPAVPPPPEPQKHHVHHSYIWLESVRTLVIVGIAVIVANFSTIIGLVADGDMDGFPAGLALALVAGGSLVLILVIFGIVVATRVISYKHLYFTVGPYEFTLYTGVFNKKQAHVPYQRVQSVDQRATLLQRIFGVCTVSIDTAGGAANSAVTVPYLTKQQAEWLRSELYERKASLARVEAFQAAQAAAQAEGAVPAADPDASIPAAAPMPGAIPAAAPVPGAAAAAPAAGAPAGNVLDVGAQAWNEVGGVFAGAPVDTGRVSYEYGLTNKELFLAGLSNTTSVSLIFAGLIVGVLQIVSFVFDVMGDAANGAVESAMVFASSQAAGYIIGALSVGIIVLVLVLWVISALGSCISYGGFKARRRNNRIEVEYGLLQHTFQGVDVDRVQSVVVKQSFIRRLFGFCELSLGKIDAAQESDASNQKNALAQQGIVIHPFVKMSRVPDILAGLIPEFADLPTESKPVAKVALRRALVRRGIIQGGGFWLAVFAVAGLLGIAALISGVEAGVVPVEEGDEHILGLLYTFGSGGLVLLLALAAVLFVIDLIGAMLWARESSFAYNRRFMQVSNGGLSRETVSFPRQKIQFGCTRSNPLQRHAGTCMLLATTAAGSGGTTTSLVDVSAADAAAWLDWVKPGGNR